MNQRLNFIICAAALTAAPPSCVRRIPVAETQLQSARSVHLANVPFFPDNTELCGPSTLASVLNYWGKPVTAEQLESEIYIPRLKGTLPLDMLRGVRRHGLSGTVSDGSFDDLRHELQKNRPVIAYLDFGTSKHPIGHFVVVTGYDDDRKGLYIHSGLNKDKFASYRRFDRGWKDTHRWMLSISSSPTSEITATLTPSTNSPLRFEEALSPEEYLELGRTYEKSGLKNEAREKYEAAVHQDRKFTPALLALGNLAFEKNDFKAAAKHYRAILKVNPADGAAHNNLAMAYLSEGKHLKQAEKHAQAALETSVRPYALDTLAQIQAKLSEKKTKRFL